MVLSALLPSLKNYHLADFLSDFQLPLSLCLSDSTHESYFSTYLPIPKEESFDEEAVMGNIHAMNYNRVLLGLFRFLLYFSLFFSIL